MLDFGSRVRPRFERRFVDALVQSEDPAVRARVHGWVASSLATMPQHLRLGVLCETAALSSWAAVRRVDVATLPTALERSPLMPLRQYVRLFRSLVLFAEQELAPAP
jgi:hypothetical protein